MGSELENGDYDTRIEALESEMSRLRSLVVILALLFAVVMIAIVIPPLRAPIMLIAFFVGGGLFIVGGIRLAQVCLHRFLP